MSRPKARAALMQDLEYAVRKSSALGVIFGQAVANRVGISSSDLECLDFLIIEGRVTAGRLAELTGLTTGAVTGMVDRLEKAGLVRRERDADDRRKVFIAIVPENIARIGRFYEPLQRAVQKNWEGYTDAELELLLRFMTQGYTTMLSVTEELKAMVDGPKGNLKETSKDKARAKGKRS